MDDRTITIIMISVILIIIVNIGLNVSLLLKKTSEDFTIINKNANTSSTSKHIIYTRVAEFDQSVNMTPEVLNFSIELSPRQNVSKYIGAFIKIDGLSVPIAIQIREQNFHLIDPNTYKTYKIETSSYPILKSDKENKFSLTYKNDNGDVILQLSNGEDISFSKDLSSIVGKENKQKKISVSFGSVEETKWSSL